MHCLFIAKKKKIKTPQMLTHQTGSKTMIHLDNTGAL